MTWARSKLLYWSPRLMGIAFALFLSLFVKEGFAEGRGFWGTAHALLIHFIPTLIVVAVLIVSWKWEWVGGVLLVGLGLVHIYLKWQHLPWYDLLWVAGPAFLVGALFLLNWRYRAEIKKATFPDSD